MEVLDSALLAELANFIGYIKSSCSVRAVVDAAEGGAGAGAAAVRDEPFLSSLQVLQSEAQRGKEEVLDAAAVASSARRFLAGLFVCCAEVNRLTKAVEERGLDATATENDMDVDGDAATQDDMDVDGRPAPGARHRQEGSGGRSCAPAGSVAALFPSSGAKRKRACGVGGGGEADSARPHKRRRMRPHQWLPFGSGRLSSAAPRRSRHARTVALARSRIRRPVGKPDARTVALASSRIQRRIGKPTATTGHRSHPSLGQHFSRISL